MPWIPLVIGAAVGLAKNEQDRQAANAERKRQAAVTRFSPWTGMQGTSVKDPSMVGNIMQGAAGGASLGQAMQSAAPADAGGDKSTYFSMSKPSVQPAGDVSAKPQFKFDYGMGGSGGAPQQMDPSQMPLWLTMQDPKQQYPGFAR